MSNIGASSSTSSAPVPRREAEPLPAKIAEFGYIPTPAPASPLANASPSDLQLHPHPAEQRDATPPTPSRINHAPVSSTTSLPISVDSTKTRKVYRSFINFLRRRPHGTTQPMPLIWGIELATVVRLLFTVVMLIGVVVGWALTTAVMAKHDQKSQTTIGNGDPSDPNNDQNSDSNSPAPFNLNQDLIFIHTGFALVTLIVCVLLERAVFMARAERYIFLHPQDVDEFGAPAGDRRRRRDPRAGFALAPWNRPPLPIYANAVGFRGTGDVEDAEIAAPPPPEYGNTRGSTLLLSTFFGSRAPPGRDEEDARGRPVSYASRVSVAVDVAEPERAVSRMSSRTMTEDAWRARRLEESLASLEGNTSDVTPRPPTSFRMPRR